MARWQWRRRQPGPGQPGAHAQPLGCARAAIGLDEKEFFSPHGIRSLSRYHAEHLYVFWVQNQEYRVDCLPAESNSGIFGGNSNWCGPVWFPGNILLFRALRQFYLYYGDSFKVECPTGSGHTIYLLEVANDIARRLIGIFLSDSEGRWPVYGGTDKFQTGPHWRDCVLLHEYFHGDNGAGNQGLGYQLTPRATGKLAERR